MGDREKRGRETYGRREKRGLEAGEKGENYTTLCNILKSKKYKEGGANNTGREPGLKGTGSGRFKPPVPPPHLLAFSKPKVKKKLKNNVNLKKSQSAQS